MSLQIGHDAVTAEQLRVITVSAIGMHFASRPSSDDARAAAVALRWTSASVQQSHHLPVK